MDAPSNSKSSGLKFAEQQMQRHGWTEGKGLGKREDGISEAIKVKVKCDTAGVGHNSAEQFTFHWWDHVFNKTASSISVEPDQDGVKVKKVSEDDGTVSSKKPRKAMLSRNMLYGRFIKSATLMSGGEQPVEEASSSQDSSDSSEDEDSKLDLSSATKLSDEDLVKICGGRTAHKGARHGLTMNAKLSRIEEQERAFMEKYGKKETKPQPTKSTDEINGDDEKRKKGRKRREGNVDEEENCNVSNTLVPRKKHKKEDGGECVEVVANGHDQEQVPSMEEDTMVLKKKKKKKQKKGDSEESGEVVVNGHDQEHKDTMAFKKKRIKDQEIDEDHSHDLSVEKKKTRPPKKKKKPVEREESMLIGHAEDNVESMEDGDCRRECENTQEETRKSKKKKKKSKRTEDHEESVAADERTAYSEDELSRKPNTEKWKVDEENGEEKDLKRKKKKLVANEDLPEDEETKAKKKKKKSKGKDRGV